MSRGRWLEAGSSEWMRALSFVPHDLYHLPDYAALEARRLGGSPRLFAYQDEDLRFLCPLVVRNIGDLAGADAVSPYGYPGPIASSGADLPFLRAASASFVDALRDAGLVSAFVRWHPLLSPSPAGWLRPDELVLHGRTVSIDLTRGDTEIWAAMRSGHRSEIKRTQRQEFRFTCDSSWTDLEAFLSIYEETMTAVGAEADYYFDRGYFEGLRNLKHAGTYLATLRLGEEPAAAAIFTEVGGLVQYHLSGARRSLRRHQPTKLLLDQTRRWLSRRGGHTLHLGGGRGGREDTLFDFKAGFSKRRHPFRTWRIVPDPGTYQKLCAATGGDESGDFFPAYRRPL